MNFFFGFMSPENRSLISVFSPTQLTITPSSSKNQQSLGHKQSQLHNQKKKIKILFNLSSLLLKCNCSSFRDILHDPFSLIVPIRNMFSALSNYSLTLSGEKSLFLQFSWLLEMEVFFVLFLTCTTKPTCSAVVCFITPHSPGICLK